MNDRELLGRIVEGFSAPYELTSALVQSLAQDLRERGLIYYEVTQFMGDQVRFFHPTANGYRWLAGLSLVICPN